MEELKKREQQVLKFIMEEVEKKGYPPSIREIAEGVGLRSTASAYQYIKSLDKKGYIKKDRRKPRALVINDVCNELGLIERVEKEMVEIPIIGQITAGEPVLTLENVEDYFPVPIEYLRVNQEQLFMLRVRGDSMIEAGIYSGDLAIMKQQNVAQNGDIVAALLGDEATIKTFFREKDHIRLQPENQFLDPIIIQDVRILGLLIGIFRTYR